LSASFYESLAHSVTDRYQVVSVPHDQSLRFPKDCDHEPTAQPTRDFADLWVNVLHNHYQAPTTKSRSSEP
jgi:hypothetical protein